MNADSGTRPSASTGLGEFLSQASFWLPDRLVELAWLEHAPFAFWLMEALKPKIFVETGTSNDFSYLALCQSVRRLGFASKGYAIGWQGDEHGIHQDKDYERLRADHDPLFGEFSRLSRSTSSEALQQFSSGSIDLLHIDRRHTYEDVKYDFESWRDKLSDFAVVLFHGTRFHEGGFGSVKFWEELHEQYPHFEFTHGQGLGVLGVGGIFPMSLRRLFSATSNPVLNAQIREAYGRLGAAVRDRREALGHAHVLKAEMAQRIEDAEAKYQERAFLATHTLSILNRTQRALERAHAQPIRNIWRYLRWRMSAGLEACQPLLGSSFARRMNCRKQKNAPGELPSPAQTGVTGFERRRRWKERSCRFILLFAPILPRGVVAKTRRRREKSAPMVPADRSADYASWILKFDTLSAEDRERVCCFANAMTSRPLISVIMPVYNVPAEWLEKAIMSVRNQLYGHWELCIADDASTAPHVREILERHATGDTRIKVHFREKNGHISACSNDALGLATGQYVGLLDNDDELHEAALFHVALEANAYPDAGIIFSDEDKIDRQGNRKSPYFKCGFSYELLLAQNLISHFGVYRRDYLLSVGGFRVGFEGSQDWDLALRVIEKCGQENVRHIPRVLYHWRILRPPRPVHTKAKPYAMLAGAKAVSEHLRRRKIGRCLHRMKLIRTTTR